MKTKSTRTLNLTLILCSLFLGSITSWLIKDIVTPLVLNGKSFENRSSFVQLGILSSLIVFTFTFFLSILWTYSLYYPITEKLQQLFRKIIYHRSRSPVLIAFVICLVNYLWGETVRLDNGVGWDAIYYTQIVQNLSPAFITTLWYYHVGRLAPTVIVHVLLKLFNMDFGVSQITQMFSLYTMGIFLVGSFFWGEILAELKISAKGRWLAYIGFFINWAILTHYFYFPIATDQTALVIGILMLYFFLRKNQVGLILATVVGAFTWPTLIYAGLCLLVLPRSDMTAIAPAKFHLNKIAAAAVTLMILGAHTYYYLFTENRAETIHQVVILSILSVVLFVYFGTKELLNLDAFFKIKDLIRSVDWKWMIVALLTYVGVQAAIRFIGQPDTATFQSFFERWIHLSLVRPFTSIIAHVAYFGPILVITILTWKLFAQEVHRFGVGLTFFSLFFFLQMMINPETRMVLPFFPLLVAFTVKVTDGLRWSLSEIRFVGIVSLLSSRIWIPLKAQSWNFNPSTDSLLEFPYQLVFMNAGPWMSHTMYIVFGSFTILIGVLFYFRFFKERNLPDKI